MAAGGELVAEPGGGGLFDFSVAFSGTARSRSAVAVPVVDTSPFGF